MKNYGPMAISGKDVGKVPVLQKLHPPLTNGVSPMAHLHHLTNDVSRDSKPTNKLLNKSSDNCFITKCIKFLIFSFCLLLSISYSI